MIDPILSLAFAIHTGPGIYALLIGSGVSRSARIPTGWDVVLDLIRKLAALKGETCEPDPEHWYRAEFGRDPDYAELLDSIAKTPTERQRLLRAYFEPTEEDREQGLKQPTEAHQAIAELVAGGFIRVILTTNFDKLTERAIQDCGVSPIVLSTPDAIEGALPLAHQQCCVVKLHGDYLDTRIKNTPNELAAYDPRVEKLLTTVLDEFGLVVCGWSGRWDIALRASIERCSSRRFTWYWATRSKLGDEAAQLVRHRDAQVINTKDADTFFRKLSSFVVALKDSDRSHPVSIEAAVALEKRYLSDPRQNIRLDDLIAEETERVWARLESYNEDVLSRSGHNEVESCSRRYFAIVERLLALLINGCAVGTTEHHSVWIESLQRLAQPKEQESGPVLSDAITLYPIVVLFYGAGLAATSRERHELLADLFLKPIVRSYRGPVELVTAFKWWDMAEWFTLTDKHNKQYTALSEHLFELLREPLRRYIPDDHQFDESFDRFEYIRSLVYADRYNKKERKMMEWHAPVGRFGWKAHREPETSIIKQVGEDAANGNEDWPLIRHGLFDRSYERFKEVKKAIDERVGKLNWW